MGFNDVQKKDDSIVMSQVTPDMLGTLLRKVKTLDETGEFDIDYKSIDKMENAKNFMGYYLSLKKIAELRKESKGKRKPTYLTHLENFKRGLTFLLGIPNNVNIINQHELRLLGKFLKKTNKDGSSEMEDIVRSWAKYSTLTDNAISVINKKHDGFNDFFKSHRDFKKSLFNYLLENEMNIDEMINSLKENEELYLSNHNNFYLITDLKEEDNVLIQTEELPSLVMTYLMEASHREKIEELDISNAQKRAIEEIKSKNTNYEEEDQKEDIPDMPETPSTSFFDDDEETSLEKPNRGQSLDDFDDDFDDTQVTVINNNNPGVFISFLDVSEDYNNQIDKTVQQWEKSGINNSKMKGDLAVTLLAYVKSLSDDLTKDDKDRVNDFFRTFND